MIQITMFKKDSFLFPVLFSLGIHGVVASFFIPSFQEPRMQRGVPIEIVWEASQEKSSLSLSSTKAKEEKKIARSNYSPQPCKKISYSHPVEQDSSSGGDYSEKGSQKQRLSKMASSLSPQRQAYHPLPKYPWISRKRRQEGVVALTIKTNEEGQVIEVNLHKSSGYAPLDESALKTVKTWIFTESNIQKVLSIAFLLKNLEGKLEARA